ncbi:MAG: LysM peptidoglycan-binding domain-containing protein [Roseiflexus sp.]|nr:LysM peptidoglycan-binding domain-containing protein [Roseiflexus sp.]MCS7288188.1 LysM peptidoglycan-binding domain-containing protein [Roseiflexus sp.]MDW8145996.1 LysM peptidoglycan-binding domain-containing protein [Roseiflexaceae bacterium]MDW8233011.1 LysM peptidoglycan-binding domain-containing protein [Roseiflexaceae bacterium]
MSQWMVFSLLLTALLLPLIGAIALRLTRQRLNERVRLTLAVIIFGAAFSAVFVLARSDTSSLRIAGLTVMQPIAAPVVEAPSILPTSVLSPEEITDTPAVQPAAATATPESITMPEPTAAPKARPEPTAAPTATPEPTAAPTATPEPTATPTQQTGLRRYVVQPGDTLRAIAERNGVTVEALLRANNLTPAAADNLRIGQELIIP